MRKIFAVIASVWLSTCCLHAQRVEGFAMADWGSLLPPDSAFEPQRLSFELDGQTFFRDAEFFLPQSKGYTASGFRLTPQLTYGLGSQARLRGGLRLMGVAGTQGLWRLHPVVAVDYRPASWFQLTMGTLQGSLGHHLDAPLYDRERWFYDYTEQGLQLLFATRFWQSDTWVNWERFLEAWTPDQERFTLGSRHQFSLPSLLTAQGDTLLTLSFPLAFVGCHRGGQFSTLDTCIETLFNQQAGLALSLRPTPRHELLLRAPFYFFQNASPAAERYTPYSQGWALHPQLDCRLQFGTSDSTRRLLGLGIGYFRGHQFMSPRGSYLFQSVSWSDPDYRAPERHMLTATLTWLTLHKRFTLSLDSQWYYDLQERKLDFAVGLVMGFRVRHAWSVGR